MKLAHTLAVFCVLGAVLAVGAAASHESLLFAEWARFSSSPTKATILNDNQKADLKHLCLKDSKQYNCASVGCRAPLCVDGNCASCPTHQMFQSDLVCCDDEHQYHSSDSSDLFTPQLRVGTCDWDWDIYSCLEGDGCNSPEIDLGNGAMKLGTAWATCYLNADAEQCGHPLCDKMVLTFRGGLYKMLAYAKYSEAPDTCFASKKGTSESSDFENVALAKVLAGTGFEQKLEELRSSPPKQNSGGDSPAYVEGVAYMMSGTVTVTSMTHHLEYAQGMLEYVPFFDGFPSDTPSGHPVKPYTYNLVLTRTSGGYIDREEPRGDGPYPGGEEADHLREGGGYHDEEQGGGD